MCAPKEGGHTGPPLQFDVFQRENGITPGPMGQQRNLAEGKNRGADGPDENWVPVADPRH